MSNLGRGNVASEASGKRGKVHVNERDLPLDDPTPRLSPTASSLLEAARRILLRDGLSNVTYENVAKESGQTQSLIRYYFKDKAGLIRSLVQSEMFLDCRKFLRIAMEEPAGVQRYHALLREAANDACDVAEYRAFLDVVADTLRSEERRPLFGSFSDWYTDLNEWVLASLVDGDCRELRDLATLTSAVVEGLAIRRQAGPHVDVRAACLLWERMVYEHLAGGDSDRENSDHAPAKATRP